ncbi:MAG: hypothetical protein GXP10_04210 [Gammaproteobacteria bacterium]|nr:hypothetical protein [Gammaproteobacteria bacterium]
MVRKVGRSGLFAFALLCCQSLTAAVSAVNEGESAPLSRAEAVAEVGGESISAAQYRSALHAELRQKFYHGKMPEAQAHAFKRELLQTLISRVLYVQEARRRGFQPDEAYIDDSIERFKARFSTSPRWPENRDRWLAAWRSELEQESLIAQLESVLKAVLPPTDTQLRGYYERHLDKFTTPQRWRVSVIQLNVDPSSAPAVWQRTLEQAVALTERIRNGERFAALAEQFSAHESARVGGALGWIHQGMLSPEAQQVVEALVVGEVSEPVVLLQGIALFRLDEQRESKVNALAVVEKRARELYLREHKKMAWDTFVNELRSRGGVTVNETLLDSIL